MQFLVQLETNLPPDLPEDRRQALAAAEAARGRDLLADGTVVMLWRLPGRLANVGVWSAEDPNELHDALVSLPLWPWMTVTITALAAHPLMAEQANLSRQPAPVPSVPARAVDRSRSTNT